MNKKIGGDSEQLKINKPFCRLFLDLLHFELVKMAVFVTLKVARPRYNDITHLNFIH